MNNVIVKYLYYRILKYYIYEYLNIMFYYSFLKLQDLSQSVIQ